MKSESNRFIAQKKFGQHFLIDSSVVENIVSSAHISGQDNVLEVGPGPGILTRALISSSAKKVTSIEIDRQFWPSLEKMESDRFSLIKKDALQISLKEELKNPIKIIANLPYNIGNKLLLNWLEDLPFISSMTLMLQDEVVKRLCGLPKTKDYGRLSILVQWLCEVKLLFTVPPTAFKPPPKVMSAVVQIIPRAQPLYDVQKEHLEKLTQLVFHQRRKMLGTSLKSLSHPNLLEVLKKVNIEPQLRPEEISVMQFCQLADELKNYL